MTEPLIQTRDLVRHFGDVKAVDGLNLAVPAGSVYGLIGPNGAGKTTAIRLMQALLRPDRGSVRLLGCDPWKMPRAKKMRIASVAQAQQLHGSMSLAEHMTYLQHFYDRFDAPFAARLAAACHLQDAMPIGQMSGGQQRLCAIILAFATRPDVMLLDEPAAGLDPIARRRLIEWLIEFVGEAAEHDTPPTVLFSTHIISDLERVADHVGIMAEGKMVAEGPLDALQTRTRRVQIVFNTDAPPPGFTIPHAVKMRAEGPVVQAVVRAENEAEFEQLLATPDARVQVFPLGLEELFIELLGEGIGDIEAAHALSQSDQEAA